MSEKPFPPCQHCGSEVRIWIGPHPAVKDKPVCINPFCKDRAHP